MIANMKPFVLGLILTIGLGNFIVNVHSFSTINRPTTLTRSFIATTTRCSSFTTPLSQSRSASKSLQMMSIEESCTFLTATVETFDGSTIVDPVIVSNVFWASLQTKVLSVIIGQIIAAIVFSLLTFVISTQLSDLGDYIAKSVFKEQQQTAPAQQNVKLEHVADRVKTKAQSPTIAPDIPKLLLCLTIDIVGTSSELLPIIGELTDVIYAPIAALALRSLFMGSNVVFALEFAEEILPLTDILPLATICWIVETYFGDSTLAKTLQIGNYGKGEVGNRYDKYEANSNDKGNDVIDVVSSSSSSLGDTSSKERRQ